MDGEGALLNLVDAYNWGNVNLKEVHKYNPKYEQRWLQREIQRVFNVDPQLCTRVAHQLGGGRTITAFEKGRKLLKRFGFFELYRAVKLLSRKQMEELPSKITPTMTSDQLHEMVDDMAEVLKNKTDQGEPEKLDYRREYHRLLKENSELKAQVKLLNEWKAKFERMVESQGARVR